MNFSLAWDAPSVESPKNPLLSLCTCSYRCLLCFICSELCICLWFWARHASPILCFRIFCLDMMIFESDVFIGHCCHSLVYLGWNCLFCQIINAFKTFLDPDYDLDHHQNVMDCSLTPDSLSLNISAKSVNNIFSYSIKKLTKKFWVSNVFFHAIYVFIDWN